MNARLPVAAAAAVLAVVLGLALAGTAAAQVVPVPAPGESPVPVPEPSRSAAPAPADQAVPDPQPGESPTPPPADADGLLGWLDPVELVSDAVSRWVGELVDSALQQVWVLLSRGLLVNPDVTAVPRVRELWQLSLGVADATFVLAVLAGGLYVMNHETVQTRYGLGDILPRLAVGGLSANLSLLLVEPALQLGNAVSLALTGPAGAAGTDALRDLLAGAIGGLGGNLFAQLAAGAVAVVGLVLAFTYVVRVAVLVVLVVGAPVALACYAVPALAGAARLWRRALAACVAIPIVQALVLSTAVEVWAGEGGVGLLGVDESFALVTLLVVGCLLWVLARVPVWACRQVATPRSGLVVSTFKYYVVGRTIRRTLGGPRGGGRPVPAAARPPAARAGGGGGR